MEYFGVLGVTSPNEIFTTTAHSGRMTADELEKFIKGQAAMSARIARKLARAVVISRDYSAQGGARSSNFARKVEQALTRPGIAPGQRPKSPAGAETFHFSVTSINRTSDFTRRLTGSRTGAGAAHEAYIERQGAAERLGAQFARTKAEMLEETWVALGGQAFIERPGAVEEIEDDRLASFGNIAESREGRLAFWEALEAAASLPRSNGVILQRGNDPAFWAKVDSDPNAPKILREALPFVPLPHNDAMSEENLPKHVPVPRHADDLSIEILEYFRAHRSKSKLARKAPAVAFDPGRGGRIQTRVIVELPYELTAERRLRLAQDFCHKKFVEGRAHPLPHWCVIHAPDHHNDPRNVHMHVVFAERPCRRMKHPATGQECWDFEIVETTKDKFRKTRSRRSFEQKTDRDVHSAHWVKQARLDFATLANQALAAAGCAKIYDARTYAAMGIAHKPHERINAKDYAKEKRGVSTAAGDKVIVAQWDREEDRLAERFASFRPSKGQLDTFDIEIARWRLSPNSVSMHLRVHKHEYKVAMAFHRVLEAERAANAFVLAKVQSKILPPLQARDEEALEAQDFIRMFYADIVTHYDEAIEMHGAAARRALTALARAQKAEPRTTDDAGFLTDRSRIDAAMPGMVAAGTRGLVPPKKVFDGWRAAISTNVAGRRKLRKAALERLVSRTGEVVSSSDVDRNVVGGAVVEDRQTEWLSSVAVAYVQGEGPSTAPSAETAKTLDDRRTTAGYEKDPGAPEILKRQPMLAADIIPGTPVSTGGSIAEGIPLVREAMASKVPDDIARRTNLSAGTIRYGDEIGFAFMSETGAPIQRRAYSPMRIRSADEQAAAVAAAKERLRAERIAKNHAELAALRVPDPDAFLRQASLASSPRPEPPAPKQPSAVRQSETQPSIPPLWPVSEGKERIPRPSEAQKTPTPITADLSNAPPARPTTPITPPSARALNSGFDTYRARRPSDTLKPTDDPSPNSSSPKTSAEPDVAEIDASRATHPSSGPTPPEPANKMRVLTEQELRRRAIMAARSRGRSR